MLPKVVLSVLGVSFFLVAGFAQGQTAPAASPLDAEALLKELLSLQAIQKQAKAGQLGQLARLFQDASRTDGDAGRLYLDAVRAVDFSSQMGDAKRFQDWRTRKKDLLDNKAFQAALKFHLRYLAITLNASAAAKAGGQPPYQELIAYVTDLAQAQPSIFGNNNVRGDDQQDIHDLLEKPLAEGKIARAQSIGPDLEQFAGDGGSKNWEPTAGNWQQILDLDVRAPMRQAKNPKLLDTWQFQMKLEGDQLAGGRDDMGRANFTQVEMPKLLWGRARDLAVIGKDNESIVEMVNLVRAYPRHPDFPAWIGELTGILKEKSGAAATSVAPAAGGS